MEGKSAEDTLEEYIRTASTTHQDRVDTLREANVIIVGEYRAVEAEIGMVREDQSQLNLQVDALISSFSQLDAIEADISQTEANIELIGKTVNRINKRIIELKKAKKR